MIQQRHAHLQRLRHAHRIRVAQQRADHVRPHLQPRYSPRSAPWLAPDRRRVPAKPARSAPASRRPARCCCCGTAASIRRRQLRRRKQQSREKIRMRQRVGHQPRIAQLCAPHPSNFALTAARCFTSGALSAPQTRRERTATPFQSRQSRRIRKRAIARKQFVAAQARKAPPSIPLARAAHETKYVLMPSIVG